MRVVQDAHGESSKMFEAVLFDFDGTLMDTDEVILRSWEEAYRGMGRPVPDRAALRATFGEPLVYSMQQAFPDTDYTVPLKLYREYNQERFLEYAHPYPGMVELIDRLRAAGVLTALVTARLRRTTYLGLEHFDLVRRFDAILTEDDIKESKPDPAPVYTTLRKLGVAFEESPRPSADTAAPQKSRVIMIGDTVHDMQCCANAGISSMLVGWTQALRIEEDGTAAAANGQRVRPDYILPRAEDFESVIEG